MQHMKGKVRQNVKKDCKTCNSHGICLAEVNTPDYICTRDLSDPEQTHPDFRKELHKC